MYKLQKKDGIIPKGFSKLIQPMTLVKFALSNHFWSDPKMIFYERFTKGGIRRETYIDVRFGLYFKCS